MASTNNSSNVSFGKPSATGAVYVAPAGTTLPTDATTALPAAFKGLGYVSEDGMTNTVETDTDSVKAWGGDTVLTAQSSFTESFTFASIETNSEVLKLYYGAANVSTDVSGNITIRQNSAALPESVVVFELQMTGNRVKRIVIPRGKIADRSGDIKYTDGDPISYPFTIVALPNTGSDNDTHKEYVAVAA